MSDDEKVLHQVAPWPQTLDDLVAETTYRPGWHLALEELERDPGSSGLTLCIYTKGFDTYNVDQGETYRVLHQFPVPPATYNEESWKRWILDCLLKVETHECCEFLQIKGTRPFAPHHGPGWDPYIILHHGSDVDARTDFRGDVQDTGV